MRKRRLCQKPSRYKFKDVQTEYLLSGVEATILAAVEQHTDDTCPVYYNLLVRSKLSVLPDYRRQPGKCGGSSSDPSLEFTV